MYQVVILLRHCTREAVIIRKQNFTFFTLCILHFYYRIQSGECNTHIRRINCHTIGGPTENSVQFIDAFPCTTACAGLPFIAGHSRIKKIRTTCTLIYVAAIGGHISNLCRCTCKNSLRQKRKIFPDDWVVSRIGV